MAFGGCGSESRYSATSATQAPIGQATSPPASYGVTPACVQTVVSTDVLIAKRVYAEAATGRIVAQALTRVARSQALIGAVARGDARSARAAVGGLLSHQIAFIQVLRGRRVLARVGNGLGIAPAGRALLDASGHMVGRYVLSIQGADGYVLSTSGLTGAQVLVRRGAHQLAGTLQPGPSQVPDAGPLDYGGVAYQAVSFAGQGFPSGALRISMLVPPEALRACAGSRDQTVANVYGHLATSVLAGELGGRTARIAVRLVADSRSFALAVANGDSAACQAEVQRFFASSRHIVRVRALRGSRLVCDVGGPFALAPLHGSLRRGGRVVGSFVTSVQDDLGFVLLVHRFTGAQLVLRDAAGEIPASTIIPAPPLPAGGRVTVRGHSYQVFSFIAQRFPSGALHVWLLV